MAEDSGEPFQCRFYGQKLPSVDDVVMVCVKTIAELGAYVSLLEYDSLEGMLMMSELSRRRIRSINKLLKIGRLECAVVTRVDEAKNYIDLSKRRVTVEDARMCQERYSRAKVVYSVMRRTAELLGCKTKAELEQLCEKTAWNIDKKLGKLTASFDVFKKAVYNPSVLDEHDIEEPVKEVLVKIINLKLPQVMKKLRVTFEVTCFEYEGIDAIKAALIAGKNCSTADMQIGINLIAPPLYMLTTTTFDLTEGQKLVDHALSVIEEKIKSFKGTFRMVTTSKEVTEKDEADMVELLDKLRLENSEVQGDDRFSGDSASSGEDEACQRTMSEEH